MQSLRCFRTINANQEMYLFSVSNLKSNLSLSDLNFLSERKNILQVKVIIGWGEGRGLKLGDG